ncbi:MAG: hypothetical protein IPP91_04765 [Betaproteobacteria bacterium]|nr:hypothetical protein [Betaproteobacteria bacterium]
MNDLTLQERLQPGAAPDAAPQAETLDIVEYWRAIAKRRWSILGLTLLVAILATLVVFAIRPSYRGTAVLLIEQGKNKVVSIEEVYNQGMIQREYYQTQVEILKSDELARKTIVKLKLTSHPDFDPRQAEPGLKAKFLGLFMDDATPLTEDAILKGVVKSSRTMSRFNWFAIASLRRSASRPTIASLPPPCRMRWRNSSSRATLIPASQ